MKAKTVNETLRGMETLDSYVKASKHVPDHPLTLVKKDMIKPVNEVNFEKGRGIKPSLSIGRKVILKLDGGAEIEGPLQNEKKAKSIIDEMNRALAETADYCEEAEIYDDAQMDEMDEVEEEYMEDLRKLGFEYTEEWR
jgi:hypothetical protein